MKRHKPTTPGRRGMTTLKYKGLITSKKPDKKLTGGFQRAKGRNNAGRITAQHRGGGRKRLYRQIDFKYRKKDIKAKIKSLEYDPNRSGFIALVSYLDGDQKYVLIPRGMKAGDEFVVSVSAPLKVGNRLPLFKIPVGTFVYNIELRQGGGAKLARSAGGYAEIIANDGSHIHLKMPSSEIRKAVKSAWASIGEVSNPKHKLVNLGKAGRNRWKGRRPKVRGSAMNPVDHPHGGGEGRGGRGRKRQKTRQGKMVGKGQKSRKPKKYSNKLIIKRRKVGKKRGI
ncbi:50S ribosomal protein L2 [Candidatus Campbellbacteria bacterium CG11_big_fil_rev_8_21_14_0_20_44_21]|uniref:Large ribosomal subunit protein uL2 n=1 Tax=Candidatus Campbellbacteria bacterium CG22_combo_CG10-13_8_21_14_all_43_18 TaxID=1974530 RepID=A0A2H0DY48_9BACT|nr:MAG: 50S ribosomal protein L2 [Candidatus Campbellbacteria bacterium CG22_combo_CG10-13_8_21_14_all_43_18]PIR24334.1 MAG: 50S ribosomal protein L2 [Candidatus Campbellbacteria bacterium CG11_big_fil_rev_8_21_14_0_20_44_21]